MKSLDSEWPALAATTEPTTPARTLSRRFISLLMAVAVVTLTVSILTLTTYPAMQTDEGWYANLAHNWIATGQRWTTVDVGPFAGGRGQGTTTLGAVPTRLGIQIWGLSLQSIRLPSLLAGVALLGMVAGVGRLLWSGGAGLLAMLVLLTQPLFLLGSHLARPEIWLALAAMLALGCSLLGWKRDQPAWDSVAALLAIVSVEIHQNGAVFALGLAATYLVRPNRSVIRDKGSLAFITTSLLGGIVYLYRHGARLLAPYESGGGALGMQASHSIPLLSANPVEWVGNELTRYLLYFGNEPLGALLVGLGILAALRRRDAADRQLLTWLLGSTTAMMLLVSHMIETYLLPSLAVGSLLVGRGIADLLQSRDPKERQAVAITFGVLVLPILLILGEHGTNRTAALHQELRQSIPCQRIVGPNQYWLAFPDCEYRSWDVVSHSHHREDASFEESMIAIRPDYLIVDDTIVNKLREDFDVGGQTGSYYALPRDAFYRFMNQQTTLATWITSSDYGSIQVREVDWKGEP